MLRDLGQVFRTALRVWTRDWRTALPAVLTLALTVGANAAFFAVANAVLLRPLPFGNPHELVLIQGRLPRYPGRSLSLSPQDLEDLRPAAGLAGLAAVANVRLTWWNGEFNEPVSGARATGNFFELLGVSAAYGRTFQPRDGNDNGSVGLISHGFFESRFGGDPSIVGQKLTLDGRPLTVVGVLPPNFSFSFSNQRDVWIPLTLDESERTKRRYRFLEVVGRLAPGSGLESARTSLHTMSLRLEADHPESNRDLRFDAVPLHDQRLGHLKKPFWIVFAALTLVLLVGCANVSSILLTKAASRQRELAVRRSLGATGKHLIRQTILESLAPALAGGAAGLGLAYLAADALSALVPADLPRVGQIAVDLPAALFTLALASTAGLICASAPSLTLRGRSLVSLMSAPGRSGVGGRRESRILGAIVALQIGLALALTVGTGLLLSSFLGLRWLDVGFEPDGVVALHLNIPRELYPDDRRRGALLTEVQRQVKAAPEVDKVGFTTALPFGGFGGVVGLKLGKDVEASQVAHSLVAGDYFEVMGIRLLRGTGLVDAPLNLSPPPVVVSESLARRLGGAEGVLGRTLWLSSQKENRPRQVVGVVEDVRSNYDDDAAESVYEPFSLYPPYYATMAVKLKPGAVVPADRLKRRAARAEPELVLHGAHSFGQLMDEGLARQSFLSRLFVGFSVIALLLLLLGIFGVVGFIARRRSQEIGIRMALGAGSGDVYRLLIGAMAPYLAVGLLAGLGASWALTQYLDHLLEAQISSDLSTVALAGLLVAAAALGSTLPPARQAARIDPSDLLRV